MSSKNDSTALEIVSVNVLIMHFESGIQNLNGNERIKLQTKQYHLNEHT